jgi:predicted enzyme related to lactoylglutathione lyase
VKLTHAPIVVNNQDEALRYYTEVLGFEKRADYQVPGNPRWLTVAPKGQQLEFILVQGQSKVDLGSLAPEAGDGGYHIAFSTTDCVDDYQVLKSRGADFSVPNYTEPQKQPWGTSAYFKDPDGNHFAMVQPSFIGKAFNALSRFKR